VSRATGIDLHDRDKSTPRRVRYEVNVTLGREDGTCFYARISSGLS
jgi:hypothetical protein